jgi:glycosyltransferase involved in cell wall biosynthesis
MTRALRVVHMTSVHRPDDPRIFLKEARSLAAAGYDVTIVAAETPAAAQATGVKFVGIRGAGRHEYVRDPDRGLARRIVRFFDVTVRVAWRAVRLRADVYHFHDPELLFAAMLMKLLTDARVVYDVHEDVPKQMLGKRYLPSPARRPLARIVGTLERVAASQLDAAIAATPPIARRFPPRSTTVVQNFPIVDELIGANSSYRDRAATACYVGGLTPERGLVQLMEAWRLLRSTRDATLIIAGRVMPVDLLPIVESTPGVKFVGWQDRAAVASVLGESRVGIVTFHPVPNYLEAYPIKLFEYMSAALPIVASDFPLWRRIVEDSGAGLVADPLDPQAIAEAVDWLLAHPREAESMGRRGRAAVEARFNWDVESRKLLSVYARLIGPSATAR